MTVWYPDYQLAVGNNNAAGLAVLEGVTPSGDTRPFLYPQVYPNWDPGTFKTRADGTLYVAGFAATRWVYAVLTKLQVAYLMTTYCNGGWSGAVTVRLRLGTPSTYANYNAILRLPKFTDTQMQQRYFRDYPLTFTRLEAL